jgi:hypothetical protein
MSVKRKEEREKGTDFDRKYEEMRGCSQLSPFSHIPSLDLTNKREGVKIFLTELSPSSVSSSLLTP